ncbi:unnamed protein product [Brassica napus]|uniref:(rape) hypothetical protein n=1 Tax=Brassica napus TaxID=3708 RepID=A0A816J911_BRANA|nr:unnamed protein product [Brassica napus]
MELTALADIKPFKSEWRIQVKVLHTWKHYTKLSGETLEIIMSDAHGTKILAFCKKTYFEKFAKKVPVGTWRTLKISPSMAPVFPTGLPIINTRSISSMELISLRQPCKTTAYVIGEVTDLGPLDTVLCSGKERKKIEFSLTDFQGRRIACCLWGKFAESIQANCKAVGGDTVICLLRFVKVGTYRDEVQISNSYDASQIFFNPPIMETEAFLKRDVASNALTLVESEQDKLEREIRRDKWMQYSIRDIVELLSSTQIEQCRIIATIYAIDKDWRWYYFGCKACNKKVNKISTKVQIVKGNEITTHLWWCEKCDDKVTKVLPKFRIHVWVKDGTGEAYLMLLDWIAIGVIPETAAALLNGSFDELQDIESFPEAITDLVGNTFIFGIYIDSNNVASKGGMYKVSKVWKDLSMLLTGGSTTESWTQSDVGTTNLNGSQGSLLVIESQANEDTVVNPPSKRKQQSNEGEPDISSTTKKQKVANEETKWFFVFTITTNMKNKEDNTRKRRTNHQPTCQSPADSKLTDGTKSDSAFRQVLGDVSNLKPNLQSSGGSQHFTQPSTYFGSGNPYYDKAKGKQPQCSKRIRANGDDNNDRVQLSNIISRRSTCLKIQPRNLLPAFSNSDSVKQHNEKMWSTSQVNESKKEDDLESSLHHNFTDEGEDYSDQSYDDVSSEESDSYEVVSDNTEEISDISPVPDEQRARIMTMADIFKTMFGGGQSSSTTPLPKLNKTEYLDEGDPTYICDYCGAKMWYGERIEKRTKTKKPKFSLCCGQGQVQLPLLKKSPEILKRLLHGDDEISKYFWKNIRQLNMVFSFTSLGGKVDRCLPQGRGPKMFQLKGENYHLMGSLKPPAGEEAKFSQHYVVDIENKIDKRASIIGKYKKKADKAKKKSLRKKSLK